METSLLILNLCVLNAASLKNIGDKASNLFERKKKEVGDLAAEKATEAQTYAEEQAKKAGEAVDQTKKEAGDILGGAGKFEIQILERSFIDFCNSWHMNTEECVNFHNVMHELNVNFICIPFPADDVNAGADALDKAKGDLSQLASDASTMADQAKSTGATLLDHAKGAATQAIAAGSVAAESIVDQKMKEAENVI